MWGGKEGGFLESDWKLSYVNVGLNCNNLTAIMCLTIQQAHVGNHSPVALQTARRYYK